MMALQSTSIDAYHAKTNQRQTQVDRLHDIVKQHPDGITDSQIAKVMGLARSQVAARRCGLRDKLDQEGSKFVLRKLGKVLDTKTNVNVNRWGLVLRDQKQTKLFD